MNEPSEKNTTKIKIQNELVQACREGNLRLIKALISQGADVDVTSSDGEHPLLAVLSSLSMAAIKYITGIINKRKSNIWSKLSIHQLEATLKKNLPKALVATGNDPSDSEHKFVRYEDLYLCYRENDTICKETFDKKYGEGSYESIKKMVNPDWRFKTQTIRISVATHYIRWAISTVQLKLEGKPELIFHYVNDQIGKLAERSSSKEFYDTNPSDHSPKGSQLNESHETLSGVLQLEDSLQIPSGDLRKIKQIGRGGFGVVHRGSWQHVDVAIKQLLHMSLSGEALAEFKAEVRVMAKLRHPHIVQLCGACMEPGQYAMVMEYVPNGSLYDVLRRPGNLSWQVRYQYGIDIGAGLSYLHSRKILHRDLKSMNVLITSSNRAKLTDFGLAMLKQESKTSTRQGSGAAGTLLWMAPELFKRGGKMSTACDVYSYGVTLWEVATGKVPFSDAQDPHIAVGWVREGEREVIPEETPPGFARVISQCWSQEPESRPSASEATGLLKSSREEVGLQGTPQVDRKGKGEASGSPRPTESVGSGSYGNLMSGAGLSSGSQGSLGSVEMNSERNNLASSAAGVAQQSRGRTRSGAYGNLASVGFSPVFKRVSKGAKGMNKQSVGRGRGRGRPLPVRKSPLKKRLMGPKGAIKKGIRKAPKLPPKPSSRLG